ncbi:MAG: hypothetical protein LBM77_10295, partial [Spirochaetaceae bacterium]|nr:hypothetical protein [Spirochaetaceae bacterium]
MKKLLCGLFLCMVMLCAALQLSAQTYKPFTGGFGRPLKTIETEHFDIIYPEESERTAAFIAGFADEVFDRIVAVYDAEAVDVRKIPVTITPDTDLFNAYMNPLPYPHLVIFDTPPNIEVSATYENAIYGLFVHELNHAITFSMRSPVTAAFRKVFGSWVSPTYLIFGFGEFMVEGSSVLLESEDWPELGGLGRANDPFVRSKLIQAYHEGLFQSALQATGADDRWASARYDFGGLFNKYLYDTYGRDKYAAFWAAVGSFKSWFESTDTFSLSPYEKAFLATMSKTYGVPFEKLWNDFMANYKIEGITENDEGLIYGNKLFTTRSSIDSLAAGGGNVFFIDSVAGWVYRVGADNYPPQQTAVGAGRAQPPQTPPAGVRNPTSANQNAGNAVGD